MWAYILRRVLYGFPIVLGVTAVVEKDNCGGMRPHLDLQQGVRLLVADADLEKARGILTEVDATAAGPAWTCAGCQEEIEGGFDACWQCDQQRP